jgi:fructose-1,6-bisphosphatase
MPHERKTFSQFVAEGSRRTGSGGDLVALLDGLQLACKLVAAVVSRGALGAPAGSLTPLVAQGEERKPIQAAVNDIILRICEESGQLCGMLSKEMAEPQRLTSGHPHGRYLLVVAPLDVSLNFDVNITVGTIFSVLRAPKLTEVLPEHFLKPGCEQIAAGFALYGPTSMIVLTLGAGVHGFTLDREVGTFVLTHPDLRISETTREFVINSANEGFWEAPVRRYVQECTEGQAGPLEADFTMRSITSPVAEVFRILIRGGLFLSPRDTRESENPDRLELLAEASPLAMIIEQAGGAASTGRERILDLRPSDLHQRVAVILGSRHEVERLVQYHEAHDRGEASGFPTPLFRARTLFNTGATFLKA